MRFIALVLREKLIVETMQHLRQTFRVSAFFPHQFRGTTENLSFLSNEVANVELDITGGIFNITMENGPFIVEL